MRGAWAESFWALAQTVASPGESGALDALPAGTTGYGASLARSLVALLLVCVAAWGALRWAAKRGVGLGAAPGRVRVLERVALDARRALFVVRADERVLLLGAGETGAPVLLTELAPQPEGARVEQAPAPSGFLEALARVRAHAIAQTPSEADANSSTPTAAASHTEDRA